MAEEDNFDIDIYGDGEGMDEDSKAFYKQEMEKDLAMKETKKEQIKSEQVKEDPTVSPSVEKPVPAVKQEPKREPSEDVKPKMQQGVKRKGESDERRIDPGATNALMISDLHWYTTEDDIRGWINDAAAEDELKDITFSEHKVNGKSKGQVYLEFTSPQASTATKHKIETIPTGPSSTARKFSVVFQSASSNPFKTLPKDAPARNKEDRPQRSSSTPYSAVANEYNSNRGGFRGRGNYNNNRGNYNNNNNNGYNNNRNFSAPMGNAGGMGGFQGNNFQNNMPMNNFGNNFNVRGGGMMGNNNFRGNMRGRGGGGAAPMMPMNMGMMGGPMNMNPMMMAGMGAQGFGAAPQFNMFNQGNQAMNGGGGVGGMSGAGGGDWGSNKRPRHE